jgi:hypothetical protein
MAGERRRRPWAAVGLVVVALYLSAAAVGLGVMTAVSCGDYGMTCEEGQVFRDFLPFGIAAALCLMGGLIQAWWTGSGRSGTWLGGAIRHFLPALSKASRRAAEVGRSWEVPEPGTSLMESAGGGGVVMWLPAGTVVVEGEVRDDLIRVTVLPGNQVGWVERQAVR